MKHLLNNLSEEEKQSILEQHNGGMKVFSENFKRLIGHKSGTILNEQPQTGSTVPQTTNSGNTMTPKGISKEINTAPAPVTSIIYQDPTNKGDKKPMVSSQIDKLYFERNPKGTIKFATWDDVIPGKIYIGQPIEINGHAIPKYSNASLLTNMDSNAGRGFEGGEFKYELKKGPTMGNTQGERFVEVTGPNSFYGQIFLDRE